MEQSKKNRTDYLAHCKGSMESEANWEKDVILLQFEKAVQKYLQSKLTRVSTPPSESSLLAP